ncbi:MAG: CopG family transcriptional regulator [Desulfuromonadaceae bacterium]|nr:CopG family transcriptional regulator [Desulfuromonadaceae bacterium]
MKKKQEIISFKADSTLKSALTGIPNRSEFIRDAILSALDNACPLCHGTGILSPSQKEHMTKFLTSHTLEKCQDCQEVIFRCRK